MAAGCASRRAAALLITARLATNSTTRVQRSLWRPTPSIAVRLDRAAPSGHRVDSDVAGGRWRRINRWDIRVIVARHDIGRWRGDRHITRCHNNGWSRVNWRRGVHRRSRVNWRRVRFHNIDALCLRSGRSNHCQRCNCSSQHMVCHGPRPLGCWPILRTRSVGVSSE